MGLPLQATAFMEAQAGPYVAQNGSLGFASGERGVARLFIASAHPAVVDITLTLFANGQRVAESRGGALSLSTFVPPMPEEEEVKFQLMAPIPAGSTLALEVTITGSAAVGIAEGDAWPSRILVGAEDMPL